MAAATRTAAEILARKGFWRALAWFHAATWKLKSSRPKIKFGSTVIMLIAGTFEIHCEEVVEISSGCGQAPMRLCDDRSLRIFD